MHICYIAQPIYTVLFKPLTPSTGDPPMERKNGVIDYVVDKLLARKSWGSAHSTKQCTQVNNQPIKRPYMAESCGGCDEHDAEYFGIGIKKTC